MARARGWQWVWGVIASSVVMGAMSPAQTFTTLASFHGNDGTYPSSALVQGFDGSIYGTTEHGGPFENCQSGCGTVFRVTRDGELTSLYSFCTLAACADGVYPVSPLALATNGKLYGTTNQGGAYSCGTVFRISEAGALTTLHSFENIDGCGPFGALVQAANGNFYGTTTAGGANGGGTVFEMTPAGTLTTLYNFCAITGCTDGSGPSGLLVPAVGGTAYGTTLGGGTGCTSDACGLYGTAFEITDAGALITLYNFCSLNYCADGSTPSSLVQGSNGKGYGTTESGGTVCLAINGCGTIFEITPTGEFATLYNFCSVTYGGYCADGRKPEAPLVQGTDGNLYGTTYGGGVGCNYFGCGTVFRITPTGVLTTLYSFCQLTNCSDGEIPTAGLLQATDGVFYGTTQQGGQNNDGTIFSLNTGLAPFVSFIRNPAKVGQQFGILGYGLTGTTTVSFNGTPANFKAQSDTLLIATVPTGATTGYITVTTPSGTLTSNVPFGLIQ